MRITESHLMKRMRWYLKAKKNASSSRKYRAEETCREWLKWAGWFRLTHKKRSELYNKIKMI
jgi:hypothetical protein